MRYLVYASQSKVAMLYPQIPGGCRGTRGGMIGLDLKFAKAEFSSSTNKDDRFFEQLWEVEDWIYRFEEVGTIDEPKTWIHLRGDVTAANFTSSPLCSYDAPPDMSEEAVIFAARDDAGNRLLLGGSGYHLISCRQFGSFDSSWKQPLYFSSSLGLLRLFETYRDDIGHPVCEHDRPLPRSEAGEVVARTCDEVLSGGRVLSQKLGTCDLLAKRLATYSTDDGVTTLATPLTVALLN